MNVPNFAIPGLMPINSPNFEEVSYCFLDGSIRKEIYRQGMATADPVIVWEIRDMDGMQLQEDLLGQYVYKVTYEGMSIFTLHAPADTFPAGHSTLIVTVNGVRTNTFEIHRQQPCVSVRCDRPADS